MEKGFYWVRSRLGEPLTVASCSGDVWYIFGGMSGRWTEAEVREDYDILDRIPEPQA